MKADKPAISLILENRSDKDVTMIIEIGTTKRENIVKVGQKEVAMYAYKPGDRVKVSVLETGEVSHEQVV